MPSGWRLAAACHYSPYWSIWGRVGWGLPCAAALRKCQIMKLTVALAGEEAAGVQALRLLVHRGHSIAAVFTEAGGDGSSASVASTAESLGVPVRAASEGGPADLAHWAVGQQEQQIGGVG